MKADVVTGGSTATLDGTGLLIEARLKQLKQEASAPALPEIANDRVAVGTG